MNWVREGCISNSYPFFSMNFLFKFDILSKGSQDCSPVAKCVDVPGSFQCI